MIFTNITDLLYVFNNLLGPEPQEIFVVYLSDVTGGATLNDVQSNITITVLKHGFPNGKFAFKDTSARVVSEPDVSYVLPLTVVRTVGVQGEVKVCGGCVILLTWLKL